MSFEEAVNRVSLLENYSFSGQHRGEEAKLKETISLLKVDPFKLSYTE